MPPPPQGPCNLPAMRPAATGQFRPRFGGQTGHKGAPRRCLMSLAALRISVLRVLLASGG